MCDEDLWQGLKLPGDVVHADLKRDDTIVGMAERALKAAPPRFVAVGLSMGGIVAFQIARLAPERLEGLVLLDTNPSADTPEKREMRTRQQTSVQDCFYGAGGRGFAGTTRAAGYTSKGMAKTRADGAGIVVIAQIEDVEAFNEIEAIASIEGIDALFIGRADLAVALGAESSDDAIVIAAVRKICRAAAAANRPVGMFLARPSDVPQWREEGASLFLLSSVQEFLLKGASALCAEVRP